MSSHFVCIPDTTPGIFFLWQMTESENKPRNEFMHSVVSNTSTNISQTKTNYVMKFKIHRTAEIWLAYSCSMFVHRWCSGWFFILREVKNWKQLCWTLWKNLIYFLIFFLYMNIFSLKYKLYLIYLFVHQIKACINFPSTFLA